jgi:hypothetical protein
MQDRPMSEQGLRNLLASRNNVAEKVGWTFVQHYDRERLINDIVAMIEEWNRKEKESTT